MELTHALSRIALVLLAGLPARAWTQSSDVPPGGAAEGAMPALTVTTEFAPARPPTPIALLLPPHNGDYGRAASALRAGFEAARERDPAAASVEMVETGDDAAALADRYRDLAARGVGVVVGPLTRAGVNALADLGTLPVPTLALNQPDADRMLPPNALAFGLPIEAEVRQLARLAFADAGTARRRPGRPVPRAVIVTAPSPLARRAATAFYDAWREQGGHADFPAEFEPRASADLGAQLASIDADAVLVAGRADLVRAVRAAVTRGASAGDAAAASFPADAAGGAGTTPTATAAPPIYATSMMTIGASTDQPLAELDGVRTIEMPWLAAPGRPVPKSYPRPKGAMTNMELQRLYALGIDAYRVAAELGRGRSTFQLDGVTGWLGYDGNGARVERTGLPCEWRNGTPVPLDGR